MEEMSTLANGSIDGNASNVEGKIVDISLLKHAVYSRKDTINKATILNSKNYWIALDKIDPMD